MDLRNYVFTNSFLNWTEVDFLFYIILGTTVDWMFFVFLDQLLSGKISNHYKYHKYQLYKYSEKMRVSNLDYLSKT